MLFLTTDIFAHGIPPARKILIPYLPGWLLLLLKDSGHMEVSPESLSLLNVPGAFPQDIHYNSLLVSQEWGLHEGQHQIELLV